MQTRRAFVASEVVSTVRREAREREVGPEPRINTSYSCVSCVLSFFIGCISDCVSGCGPSSSDEAEQMMRELHEGKIGQRRKCINFDVGVLRKPGQWNEAVQPAVKGIVVQKSTKS